VGEDGKLFCLVDARNAEAAKAVHHEAHGLVAPRVSKLAKAPKP
jgi:hypothetical protein